MKIQNVKRHFFRSLSSSTHFSGFLFSINWFPQDSALWWWSSFTPSTPRSTLASLHLTSSPVSIWWGFRDQNRKLGILPDSCSIAERKNYSFFFRFSTRGFTTCLCLAIVRMICFQVEFHFEVWVLGPGFPTIARLKNIIIQIANLVLTGLLLFKDFEDTTGRQICAVALFTSGLKRKREK